MSASRTQYSSPFDPSSIPGCQIWIDASDPSTVTTSGGVVTAVQDKSSNKYNLSNGNGFTYNVTKFNTSYPSFYRASSLANARVGSNTSISTTQPYTMAFVVQADIAVGTARTFLRSTLSTTDTFINFESLSSSSTNRFGLWAGSSTLRANANVPISVTIVTVNAASTTGIQNSTTTLSGNPGPFGLVGVNIGGDTAGSFVGHICEFLIWTNTVFSTVQRQQLEGYLALKWGIPSLLPATHPFRSIPPTLRQFTPLDVPNCIVWLDAADRDTIVLSGSNVTTWRDKSGNGYDGTGSGLVLPTYSSNIFNGGYPGITISNFTQSNNTNDNRFQFTIPANTFSSGFSAISVYRPTNSTNGNSPYSRPIGGAIPRPIDTFTSSTLNRRLIGNGTQYWEITITAGTGYSFFTQSNTIYSFSANSNTFFSWNEFVNGVASPVAGSLFSNGTVTYSDATSTTLRLQLMGIHCEHILFNGTLSVRNRQLLEGYLARKWGLQSNMPVVHPYRFSPLTGFTPTSLTGCALWLDAADASTFTLSGTTVTQWRDKSGNARNCSAGFGTGPSYSNLAVNFAGTNGLVNPLSASVTTESAFIVASIANTTGTLTFLGVQTGAGIGGRLFFISSGVITTQRLDINNVLSDGVVVGANQRNLFEYVNTGTTLTHYLNGNVYSFGPASTYSTGLASAIGTRTGNIWRFIGSMHEIIVYSNALSSNDRQQVEGYLAQKWGISDALGHSFGSLGVPPIVAAFVPTAISGSILWWDAADRTVFTGGATWIDKSGSNNTGINGTPGASTMPTLTTWDNGNSAARFVAGNKNSVKTTNTIPNLNVTYFMVARVQAAVGYGFLMINNVDGQRQVFMNSTSFPVGVFAHANGSSNIQFASVAQSEPFLYGATIVSGASGFLTYTNGTANATRGVTTSSASTHYFGSGNGDSGYLTIDIGEVIIYNTVLSTTNRQLVEGYLAWKWGLQTRLPTNHPYRAIKP